MASIWGMNFRHMPELDWRISYPAALIVMAVVVLGTQRVLKRAGWI
jgi:magnesium transporter